MKYKILLLICLLSSTYIVSNAQVKIGDNPNSINANSLLELESSNKGFLAPRVMLSYADSVTPMTAPVPAGMLVYSSGGTLADGYYLWNGTKWVSLLTSKYLRTNYVLVKSASDFPAAVGGVRTLDAGTLYEINGTITLTDKIDLNGCAVSGRDVANDKLIYTGSAELFTGTKGGILTSLTLMAPAGKVFNINAGGDTTANLAVLNCLLLASSSVGTIRGFGSLVRFADDVFIANANGVTYQDCNYVLLENSFWHLSNTNTYETFTGAFTVIEIKTGLRIVLSGNTALNISGITSLVEGSNKGATYLGTGTLVNGTFSSAWEVESIGLNTEKDDVASGNIYISSSALTTIATMDVPVKVAGTTTALSLFRVTMPSSNRLTYTGSKTRRFQVIVSITGTCASSNRNFSFHIYKNGSKLPESTQSMKLASGVSAGSLTLSCTVSLATNDYIEVWAENNSDNTDITVENMNLSIK